MMRGPVISAVGRLCPTSALSSSSLSNDADRDGSKTAARPRRLAGDGAEDAGATARWRQNSTLGVAWAAPIATRTATPASSTPSPLTEPSGRTTRTATVAASTGRRAMRVGLGRREGPFQLRRLDGDGWSTPTTLPRGQHPAPRRTVTVSAMPATWPTPVRKLAQHRTLRLRRRRRRQLVRAGDAFEESTRHADATMALLAHNAKVGRTSISREDLNGDAVRVRRR